MGRPKTEIPVLHINKIRAYFNSAACVICKIGSKNTHFYVARHNKERGYIYIRFNNKEKGYRCGKPTKVRQSQFGHKKFLRNLGLDDSKIEGKFSMKYFKKTKRWRIKIGENDGKV